MAIQNTIKYNILGWLESSSPDKMSKFQNCGSQHPNMTLFLHLHASSLVTDYMILNLNSLSTPRGKCCFLLGIRQRVNKTIHKVLINAKHTVSIQETVFILHRNNCVLPNTPYDKIQGEKNIYNIYGSHRLLSLTYNMLTA